MSCSVHFLDMIHIIQRPEGLDDLAVFFILLELRAAYGEGDGEDAEAGISVGGVGLDVVDAHAEGADG